MSELDSRAEAVDRALAEEAMRNRSRSLFPPSLIRAAEAAHIAQLHLDSSLGMVREALIALRAEHGALRLGRRLGISDQYVRMLCAGSRQPGRELIAKILEVSAAGHRKMGSGER